MAFAETGSSALGAICWMCRPQHWLTGPEGRSCGENRTLEKYMDQMPDGTYKLPPGYESLLSKGKRR